MRKWILPLLLLSTVLLLISFAFLPALAGVLQDVGTEKTVSNRTLHSIVPYISENGSGLLMEDKLNILQECEISYIVPAMASMTEEQVHTAVAKGIQPYVEAGIMQPFETWELQVAPRVAISWQDASHWFLFWDVQLVDTSGDTPYSLTVAVDDETGKFLMMHYSDPSAAEKWQLWDEEWFPLEQFARIWLEQAGLWEHVLPVSPETGSQQQVGTNPDYRETVYEFRGEEDRSLYICFSLSAYGDYTMWIKSMPQ